MTVRCEIILVHGLWFGAWIMKPLAGQLRQRGYRVRRFNYRSTRGGLDSHARRLRAFAARSWTNRQHFIAHSLGGLVTLRMLSTYRDLPPGRVVLLGSPLGGSSVARKTQRLPGSRRLLGDVRPALHAGFTELSAGREIGMIAGSRTIGLGLLVGGHDGPGDGTVSIGETQVDGLADHRVLPVTHTSMLYSAQVADQAARFLENGSFEAASA